MTNQQGKKLYVYCAEQAGVEKYCEKMSIDLRTVEHVKHLGNHAIWGRDGDNTEVVLIGPYDRKYDNQHIMNIVEYCKTHHITFRALNQDAL